MRAIWFRLRAELRTRWRGLVAVGLLAGTAGGVTLAAIAGARRTDSAFERLSEATEVSDVLVNPDLGTDSALRAEDVARLPQVVEAGRADGLFLATTRLQHPSDFRLLESTLSLGSDGVIFTDFERLKMLEGRNAHPNRANEVVIDTVMARRQKLEVGDRISGVGFGATEEGAFNLGPRAVARGVRNGEIGTKVTLTVVGIGVVPDQIVVDQGFKGAYVLLTPAFQERYPEVGAGFFGVAARLKGGSAAIPAFRRAVQQLVPDEAIAFQTAPVTAAKFARAVRPDVGALLIFGIVVALTGFLLVGQAIARQSFIDGADSPTLHALGLARRDLFGLAMLRHAVVAIVAASFAVGLAAALSPLTPIGPARTAEPDPGFAIDLTVLGIGFLLVLVGVVALALWPAWRHARAHAGVGGDAVRPSRTARVLADGGAPVTVATGVRMALEPGRGATAVPVRTTILALGLAVALVVGAVGIAASIDHLVETPRLYGWNWEVQLDAFKVDPEANATFRRDVDRLLDRSPAVNGWSTILLSDISLGSGALPALGIDPSRPEATPTLVSGRIPRRDGEIALGVRSLRALDASIGSRVEVRANNGSLRRLVVVGRVVLPGIGTYPGSDKTALGEGAVLTQNALRELGPDFHRRDYIIDFADGASAAARSRVLRRAEQLMGNNSFETDSFAIGNLREPSDIISYGRVQSTPVVLAGVLALLAVASVFHALATTVRRRRRELALLATLGFTRQQVSSTVAWQATTVAVLAMLGGIPLGLALGRTGWNALADDLGTVAEPVVPVLIVVAIAVGTLLVTNLAAVIPARLASHLRPAVVLRSE